MRTRSTWAIRAEASRGPTWASLRRLGLCTALGGLGSLLAPAPVTLAESPPSDFEKLTAPLPPQGRRGTVPAPRLPDRMLRATLQADEGASELGLRRQDDGSYLYLDPGGRFSARLELDGRLLFADRWRRPSASRPERGTCCGRPPEGALPAGNPFWAAPVPGPLEWATRSRGRDPAASAKAQLLEKTRAFRTRLAVAWALDLISTRLAALDGELQAIWNADALPTEDKRRLLFARWDECAERFAVPTEHLPDDAIVRVDEARVEAAMVARAEIAAFVRRHAPSGDPLAYTAEELERLNAKRVSVRPFAPYASEDTP
jgi:hypothetical protein